jgi:hypothetical protein
MRYAAGRIGQKTHASYRGTPTIETKAASDPRPAKQARNMGNAPVRLS